MSDVVRGADVIVAEYLAKVKAIVGRNDITMGVFMDNTSSMIPIEKSFNSYRNRKCFSGSSFYIYIGEYDTSGDGRTKYVAYWKLTQIPGCCGVCVSHGAGVYEARNKGLGTLLNQMRIEMARNMGYGVLISTDVDHNLPQRKILSKNKWTDVYRFQNPRTNNIVNVSVIDLVPNTVRVGPGVPVNG